ncbi:hypothetical protein L1887_32669 [Cichorium endivia]|nr:hypothetical protein L1887_32669 [Cichorium endivia]
MDASFPRGLWPPKLFVLDIGGLKKPISEWGPQNFPTSLHFLRLDGGPHDDVTDFSQLSDLVPLSLPNLCIYKFEKLESVANGLKHLTSLQHLSINDCPKTMDLPEALLNVKTRLLLEAFCTLSESRTSYQLAKTWS